MTSYTRWTAFLTTALLFSGTAAAQSPGSLLVGGFGQYTHFDKAWNLDTGLGNSLGFGWRFGGYFAPDWNLEGDGSYTPATSKAGFRFLNSGRNAPGGAVKASTMAIRVVHTFPPTARALSFHLGAGGVLENFRDSSETGDKTYQLGLSALGGANIGLGGLTLRVDGFGNYLPSADGKFDFGVQAGVQFTPDIAAMFGRGRTVAPMASAPTVWWDSLDTPLPGTLELGGFLQATHFSDSAGRRGASPTNGLGVGARAGVFLMDPRWELEWDGYYAGHTNGVKIGGGFTPAARPSEVNAHAFATRINYNRPLGGPDGHKSQLMYGVGFVRTSYKFVGGSGPGSVNDTYSYNYGVSGLLGFRTAISNRTAVRFEGVLDDMPNAKPRANVNFHLRGGVSWLIGGAR
jgi:hypothetical protein